MTEREEWLTWINDQMKDMYNDDSYTKVTNLNNRVFKTLEDDREVAMMLLSTLKQIMENNPKQ